MKIGLGECCPLISFGGVRGVANRKPMADKKRETKGDKLD